MNDWLQYAIGPALVGLGAALANWWQKRTDHALSVEKDDLAELRQYRAQIDKQLAECRDQEALRAVEISDLKARAAGLEARLEAMAGDLRAAVEEIKVHEAKIRDMEALKAEQDIALGVIQTDRDSLRARLDHLEHDQGLRRQGLLKTRKTDQRNVD